MFTTTDFGFGPESRNRIGEAVDRGHDGAVAALESFYFALNNKDDEVMAAVWSPDPLAQLNNPVGGILRGGREAVALYRSIFASGLDLQISFGDAATYLFPDVAVFAGRESGTYTARGAEPQPLQIRTSRFFAFDVELGRWVQVHHHGSIDAAEDLAAYQLAVSSAGTR